MRKSGESGESGESAESAEIKKNRLIIEFLELSGLPGLFLKNTGVHVDENTGVPGYSASIIRDSLSCIDQDSLIVLSKESFSFMSLPMSRSENIVVQEAGAELLVYDLRTHRAFCLNETSTVIYQACDGRTTFEQLKRKYKFSDDLIQLALDELRRQRLIDGENSNYFGDLSRREVIKRVGLASLVALPVITGLPAPAAAQALSFCTAGADSGKEGLGGFCICPFNTGPGGNTCGDGAAQFRCKAGCTCRTGSSCKEGSCQGSCV